MIVGIAGMAWWGKERADRKYHELEAKWSARENQLKAQLDEQIAALKETASRPANPKPAAVVEMTRGDPTKRNVAFTFDGGGENARSAVGILEALKARSIHTTIFVTGRFIQEHPDLVRRMVGEGHELANHLVEHKAVVDQNRRSIVTRDELLGQLRKVQALFTEATGKEMSKLWRAPYGELNREVLDWASQAGYTHVGWTRSGRASLDTLDWVADPKSSLYRTPNQIMEKILSFEKSDRNGLNGAVVLMHLGSERTKDYPYESLPKLLDEVSKRGYHAVTVGDLLRTTVASR